MDRTVSAAELIRDIRDIQVTGIAFLVLLISSVSVRMYVRLFITKKFDVADWAMLATFVCLHYDTELVHDPLTCSR